MIYIFNKTSIGYAHINSNMICQDYSDSYVCDDFIILTACDGHGGKIYIRSDVGAKLASQAIIDVVKNIGKEKIKNLIEKENLDRFKLELICKWNELIEKHYSDNPFTEEELNILNESQKFVLLNHFVTAYGTTLNAAILTEEHLICIQIGDGGIFLVKDNDVEEAIKDNNENIANLTFSLCGDDAYSHLYIKVYNKEGFDGVIICTDGVLTPYQTYSNLNEHFIRPIIKNLKVINSKTTEDLDAFIDLLGKEIGVGDDVSLGIIYYR